MMHTLAAQGFSFDISPVEIVLFVAGGVFTLALLLLFGIVLRKELKKDRAMQQREREAREHKADD